MSTSGAVFVYYSRRSVFFLFPQMKTKLMLDSLNLFLKSVPSLPSYTALSFRVYAVLQTTNSSPENHMQLSFLTLDHDLGGGHYAALSHFFLTLFVIFIPSARAALSATTFNRADINFFSFLTILPSLVLCFDTHTALHLHTEAFLSLIFAVTFLYLVLLLTHNNTELTMLFCCTHYLLSVQCMCAFHPFVSAVSHDDDDDQDMHNDALFSSKKHTDT